MESRTFGTLPTGETIEAYTLSISNVHGSSIDVLDFDSLDSYVAGHPYFGAIVGRIAGRVSGGLIELDGIQHALTLNDRGNHLHGGRIGLDKRVWRARPLVRPDGAASLQLTYCRPEGDPGYPGNLDLSVTHTLTGTGSLVIELAASADRPTPLSLTHHSYFNLAGEGQGQVLDHEIEIWADTYMPLADDLTLSGRRETIAGRRNDFRRPQRLGAALPGIFKAHGDLYLLRSAEPQERKIPALVARAVDPCSGRVLEVYSDEECLQLYTGVAVGEHLVGKSGHPYGPHAGFCIECHGFPDATRVPGFGDILVSPRRPQRRTTIYMFSTR
jgi:aldose 1-epimerase